MFVWLQNFFNIQDSDCKYDVFESDIRKRFTNWRSELMCKYITGTYKKGSQKKIQKDDEGGQKEKPLEPPYVIYPQITKEDWEEFVKQNSHPTVLVSVYILVVFFFEWYVCIHI